MDLKKEAVFIICEYNPFHYGHAFQIASLKKEYGAVICVMSGDAVQRGAPAMWRKTARARAAASCGADLVFELPFPYCCLAAPDFARAGVDAAAALGCGTLAFGAEAPPDIILAAASADAGRAEASALIRRRKNLSYPKAAAEIVSASAGAEAAEAMKRPNNILAAEYIRAVRAGGYDMAFEIIHRDPNFESSSDIRASGDPLCRIPPAAAAVLAAYPVRREANLDAALMASARSLTADSDVYGIRRGDVLRLRNAALASDDAESAVNAAVTASMTRARARRGMLCALLGITSSPAPPEYIRVLAADERGFEYISSHKKQFALPVVSKPGHISRLGDAAKRQYAAETAAEAILALASDGCRAYPPKEDNNTAYPTLPR